MGSQPLFSWLVGVNKDFKNHWRQATCQINLSHYWNEAIFGMLSSSVLGSLLLLLSFNRDMSSFLSFFFLLLFLSAFLTFQWPVESLPSMPWFLYHTRNSPKNSNYKGLYIKCIIGINFIVLKEDMLKQLPASWFFTLEI